MKRTYNPVIRTGIRCLVVAWFLVYSSGRTQAQFSFEEVPINYGQTPATDRVARLAEKLITDRIPVREGAMVIEMGRSANRVIMRPLKHAIAGVPLGLTVVFRRRIPCVLRPGRFSERQS